MDDFEAILKTEYSCLLVSFGLFLAPYTKLAFVPVVMATIILIGVIL